MASSHGSWLSETRCCGFLYCSRWAYEAAYGESRVGREIAWPCQCVDRYNRENIIRVSGVHV